ncbi:respiratory nitrate reductase subunit gamma [Neobacillus sp. YIM B02564]|jgi:nitrate reductase gamma subunit|uniref:Respiratory nitrate reductase subunit gamma n=1 Tax=Neobacillus paridis TaxID=2803862 RepID=A0ABS1TRK6_9BACI|nr:respiratory nitrate reductase subunit gamma [Neobacillus paridis]MBL4953922.1 respiratory nitrate reductase subunit gamma [Neobacillus paridis]
MTFWQNFFWISFPYIMLTMFVVGHIYRYNTDQFGWSAKSSEFLEKRQLKWGSVLFHYGIIFVFFGHVAGILIPKAFYDSVGITDHMYHFGAVWIGGIAGLATIIGVCLLMVRRFTVKRIYVHSTFRDILVLVLLTLIIFSGFVNTVWYTGRGVAFEYRETISPWFRGILTLNPDSALMAGIPLGFQIHVVSALLLFGIWPFTRLVHVWSLPLEYLKRKYIVYRAVFGRKALAMSEDPEKQ